MSKNLVLMQSKTTVLIMHEVLMNMKEKKK